MSFMLGEAPNVGAFWSPKGLGTPKPDTWKCVKRPPSKNDEFSPSLRLRYKAGGNDVAALLPKLKQASRTCVWLTIMAVFLVILGVNLDVLWTYWGQMSYLVTTIGVNATTLIQSSQQRGLATSSATALVLPWSPGRAPKYADPPNGDVEKRAQEISQAWSSSFGLADRFPPTATALEQRAREAPWAPHLDECAFQEAHRNRTEDWEEGSRYPSWACAQVNKKGELQMCPSPHPPWVRGADEDNLPLTRTVQRDLWVRQFPPNCSDPSLKFLVALWPIPSNHGIGSMLHLMATALSYAVSSNRILVPGDDFHRAGNEACKELGRSLSSECYFFPITSRECRRVAMAEIRRENMTCDPKGVHVSLSSSGRTHLQCQFAYYLEQSAANMYANSLHLDAPFAIDGKVPTYDEHKLVSWWKAQSLRFLLRWPTAYLCHITNRARHEAYGRELAFEVAEAEDGENKTRNLIPKEELEDLAKTSSPDGTPLEQTTEWRLHREAHMLRPIISIHVRQGDKGTEMKLFGFDSFMRMAYRLKKLVPGMKYIWLSTEMQDVVDATTRYPDWMFFYTNNSRQNPKQRMVDYESQLGYEEHTGKSFANLIISSQCDYFIGTLGSNWNRMINELRLTNGRKKANYMALNTGEW